jgi:hypothetical protein
MLLTAEWRHVKRGGYHLVIAPSAPNWLATNSEGI